MRCPNCGWLIEEPRGREQSRLLHKAIHSYANAVGYDHDWAKVELKFKHGLFESVPLDLTGWEPPPWAGEFHEMYPGSPNHGIVFVKSEAALSKNEEAKFIDFVIGRAVEVGADLNWYYEYEEARDNEGAKKED